MLKQNKIASNYRQSQDLEPHWSNIVQKLVKTIPFTPSQDIRKSHWWNRPKVGAVTIKGHWQNQQKKLPALLKIQGSEPDTTEAQMIEQFNQQNQSQIIRAPQVYYAKPWSQTNGYAATVLEYLPCGEISVTKFFKLLTEYRQNCLQKPWLKKPTSWNYQTTFQKWLDTTQENRKKDLLVKKLDYQLAQTGIKVLTKKVKARDLKFMHAHLDFKNFKPVTTEQKVEFVVTSNLYWSWHNPDYDLIFGYHWHLLEVGEKPGLTIDQLKSVQKTWLEKMSALAQSAKSLQLARLERALPALLIDRHLIQNQANWPVVVKFWRTELKQLIQQNKD